MEALKIALKLDTIIQGIVIIFGIGSLIAFAIDGKNGWIALTAFFLLGGVQVLSAIIMGIALKDKRRSDHILQSLFYFLAYIPVFVFLSAISELIYISEIIAIVLCASYIIGIPIYFAVRYFRMTIRDMIKVNTLHRSFWDI